MKCRLCDQDLASVFQTRILSSEREINALRFLKNDPACFGPKSGPYSLCIGCSKRIKMVVAMQQEFDTSSKANVKTDEETEKKNYDDDEDVEEEDIELETRVEEDILIDSDSNDPEYAPPFKKAKKHQAAAVAAAPSRKRLTPRRSSVAAAAALHLDDEITTDSACRQIVSSDDGNKKSGDGGNDYVVCQLCNARIRRVASLR